MAASSHDVDVDRESNSEDEQHDTVEQAIARELYAVSEEDSDGQDEAEPTRCLFTDAIARSPKEALRLDATNYGFSLEELCVRYHLGLYASIRLVNCIRRATAANSSFLDATQFESREALLTHLVNSKALNSKEVVLPTALLEKLKDDDNDELLRPVLVEDPLLGSLSWCGDDGDDEEEVPDEDQRDLEQQLKSLPERISAYGYDVESVRAQPARVPL